MPQFPNVSPVAPALDVTRATELARSVAGSLPGNTGQSLESALVALGQNASVYEASCRRGRDGALSAQRMMIERACFVVVEEIAAALNVALPVAAATWYRAAVSDGVPIIAGWDLRGGSDRRCVKLYVNASDASRTSRSKLCRALLPDVPVGDDAPAVVGMNARADGVIETKVYEQAADAVHLARGAGAKAEWLAAAARGEGADAGGVLSSDAVDGTLRTRAFFVALREPPDETGWRFLQTLPGYDASAIASLLPFMPAPPRSVGIAPDDDTWTLYFKPHGSGTAPEALEPTAVFRCGSGEVGVFVEPNERAERAFRRTARQAVSIRVREGDPPPHALESLVDWFTAAVSEAERGGVAVAANLDGPPSQWRLVATAARGADAGELR